MNFKTFKRFSDAVISKQLDFDGFSHFMKQEIQKDLGDVPDTKDVENIIRTTFKNISNNGKKLRKQFPIVEEVSNKNIDSFLDYAEKNSTLNRQQRRNIERQERKKNKNKTNNKTRLIPFPNGNGISSEVTMENNTANGLCKVYWESGKLRLEVNMVNGKEHGFYRSYHENGQIEFDSNRKNNLTHGHQKQYYENGQLWVENDWVDGRLNGESKVWWSNGKPKSFGYFKNNKHHGFFREWDENGNIKSESTYVDGNSINTVVA